MAKAKKIAVVGRECVACGSCVNVCPRNAICIHHGVTARVDSESCIGCGKCAKICPAAIIRIAEREAAI